MDSSSVSGGGTSLPILTSSSKCLLTRAARYCAHTFAVRYRAATARALALLLVTVLAVLIHGYHLGVDDAAIYVPAIKSVADPTLYPFGSEFFMSHAHLSFFPDIVGESARLTRLPNASGCPFPVSTTRRDGSGSGCSFLTHVLLRVSVELV